VVHLELGYLGHLQSDSARRACIIEVLVLHGLVECLELLFHVVVLVMPGGFLHLLLSFLVLDSFELLLLFPVEHLREEALKLLLVVRNVLDVLQQHPMTCHGCMRNNFWQFLQALLIKCHIVNRQRHLEAYALQSN